MITSTSQNFAVINLSASAFLTNMTILANTNRFAFNTEPLLFYTSANRNEIINLTGITSVYNITILPPAAATKFNLTTSPSVLLALRSFITIDFASRTSFNSPDKLDFDPPQYWVGA